MNNKDYTSKLDILIPNPKCELNYNTDYEFLLAVMLSAQTTDKRVNQVTETLFKNKTLKDLDNISYNELTTILRPLGSFSKKAEYFKGITKKIIEDCNGIVPNDRAYLESLPGVGRKTVNVVISELFDVPTIAVDTHVERVSKRLGIASSKDDVIKIEKKIRKIFDKSEYNRVNHQLLLFGRYICKAKNPECNKCLFKETCKYYKKIKTSE